MSTEERRLRHCSVWDCEGHWREGETCPGGQGSRYPRPFGSTGDPLEDEGEWYGEDANGALTGPLKTVEVTLVPDTARLSHRLRVAAALASAPLEVRYAAHLAAKLEELKAREELERELAPATPWPSIVDAIAEAAAEVVAPYLEAWRNIARAAAEAVRYVMSVPSVRRYAYREVDARARAAAIREGRRYWTDHRNQPRRTPHHRPILHNGKAYRRGR